MRFFRQARFAAGVFVSILTMSLALVACNSTNVDKENDGPGGGGGGGGALGKAGAFDFSDTAAAAVAAEFSGEYEVAIFAARDSLASNLGKGTFSAAVQGDSVVFTLKNASGASLARRSLLRGDLACGDGSCFNIWRTTFENAGMGLVGPGWWVSMHDYWQAGSTTNYFDASFYESGVITGSVTGYKFRNSILAYGAEVPAQLRAMAGAYSGPAEQLTCSPNPVAVDVNGDSGSVRVRGKASLSCEAKDHTVAWNGNDDLVIAAGSGEEVKVILNLSNGGGSQLGGGVFMTLPSASATAFSSLGVNFAGLEGGINLVAPVKQ